MWDSLRNFLTVNRDCVLIMGRQRNVGEKGERQTADSKLTESTRNSYYL